MNDVRPLLGKLEQLTTNELYQNTNITQQRLPILFDDASSRMAYSYLHLILSSNYLQSILADYSDQPALANTQRINCTIKAAFEAYARWSFPRNSIKQ